MNDKIISVVVWNEARHEKTDNEVKKIYPDGMHKVIAEYLNGQKDIKASTATLDEPEHGLTEEVLKNTDVLIWWGHIAHQEVKDVIVEKVHKRILKGMGLIVLHSGHKSKIFMKLMGTSGKMIWREAGEKERLWNIEPSHPISKGINDYFEIEQEEMYGERFDIPTPDKVIFISWFAGGEVFRSGCVWKRGYGKIFYFRPGHETYPTYYNENVLKIITNAVRWVQPQIIKEQTSSYVIKSIKKNELNL
jgi:trehalose utilization protein